MGGAMSVVSRIAATVLAVAGCFAAITVARAQEPAPVIATAPAAVRVGVVQPKAQIVQGNSTVDLGDAVLQALITDMSGPRVEFVSLKSRIQVQIDAEAQLAKCDFVIYTSVVQAKKKSTSNTGLLSLAAAAGPLASMASGSMSNSTYYAGSAAASAAQTAAYEKQRRNSAEAMASAAQGNILKGDEVSLEYKLMRPGDLTPVAGKKLSAKARDNGQDVLSPMVEQAANEILTALLN